MNPLISIVWATNAGKSSLFNHIIGNFRAIVTDVSWTTRDRLQDECKIWLQKYEIIDSPWLEQDKNNKEQIVKLIDRSDVILFVVNSKVWWTTLEDDIYSIIIKSGKIKNTILVINKLDLDKYIDEDEQSIATSEYMQYGFENIIWASTKSLLNIDLIQTTINNVYRQNNPEHGYDTSKLQDNKIRFAIVGKPNWWKSTIINRLAKEYISKVWNEPGTTLDYITTDIKHDDNDYLVYDTAGIRKRSRYKDIESIAHAKTFAMLKFVQPIVVLVIDGSQWITNQDHSVIDDVIKLKLPFVIAINKMDLLDETDKKRIRLELEKILKNLKRVDKIYISALNNSNMNKVLERVKDLHNKIWSTQIPTPELNKYMQNAALSNPPKFSKNRVCKFYYVTQIPGHIPPKFVFFINDVWKANNSYGRRLENTIRKWYDFQWLPIIIEFKDRDWETDRL